MNGLKENHLKINESVLLACKKSGRSPQDITLVAVSKTKPITLIEEAYQLGLRHFGENYVQEWQEKYESLKHLDIKWHFIGHLQRRKVKDIVGKVALIHSVDSIELLEEINKRAGNAGIKQRCLLQINIGNESSKSGLAMDHVLDFMNAAQNCPHVLLEGLMIIPPASEDPEQTRPYFSQTKKLSDQLGLKQISMGMSGDFEVAIEEGASLIRVGTSLFGNRS